MSVLGNGPLLSQIDSLTAKRLVVGNHTRVPLHGRVWGAVWLFLSAFDEIQPIGHEMTNNELKERVRAAWAPFYVAAVKRAMEALAEVRQ